jgi:hypothetical protein
MVKTQYGKLKGFVEEGVHTFLGVPFAQAPFGKNRFHPPRRPEAWDGTRDATGQYIFVIPELEIVAVFNSSLRPHEALDPIRLVEKHLIPAVKSNRPLPHNPEAFAILKQAISQGIKSPIDF